MVALFVSIFIDAFPAFSLIFYVRVERKLKGVFDGFS